MPSLPRVAHCRLGTRAVERAESGLAHWGERRAHCHRLEGNVRVKWVKGIAVTLVVVFALFYMISRPEDAATAVEGAVGAVVTGAEAVGRFFTTLAT